MILIVDDEPEIVEILVGYLGSLYETLSADNVPQAKTFLKTKKVDLLITDLGLPDGSSGEELLDFINVGKLNIPTIVLSGLAEQKNEVLKKGASGWLKKPFRGQALMELVQEVFSNSVTPKSKK